jgi:predicted DNA-binding protein with PD1-like motif
MRFKLLHETDGKRTFAVVLKAGDEAMACLQEFARSQNIGGAQITAIGAFSAAELAFFDWQTKAYLPIEVPEQVEVASLIGDIARGPDGRPAVHVHAVLSDQTGTARAGHFMKGHVRPTLEIIVTETPEHLTKTKDAASGLALIDLG